MIVLSRDNQATRVLICIMCSTPALHGPLRGGADARSANGLRAHRTASASQRRAEQQRWYTCTNWQLSNRQPPHNTRSFVKQHQQPPHSKNTPSARQPALNHKAIIDPTRLCLRDAARGGGQQELNRAGGFDHRCACTSQRAVAAMHNSSS